MSTVLSIIAIVVSVVSACAVVGSWRVARRAQHDAARVRQIEQDRRHDELAPTFEFAVTLTGNANDSADLDVKFVGGPDHLDEVVFTILDEAGQDHWVRGLPDRITPEVAEQFIWGPWEFNTGAREQIADLRRTKPRGYSRSNGKDWDRLPLVRTRAGFWMSGMTAEQWRADHAGPLRLQVSSRRNGYEPWQAVQELEWQGSGFSSSQCAPARNDQ